MATPPTKQKNSKGEPLSWDEIFGKLMLHGFTPEQIGEFTLRNAHQVLNASAESFKANARVHGATFDEDEDIVDVNDTNAGMLESIINGSFGR